MFPNLKSGRVCLGAWLWITIGIGVLPASGEESKDDLFLGGKHPRFDGYEGYALNEEIPINELPARIKFDIGKLSLVPDPTDARGIYMVVYLVNDTDQPVSRAVGENQDVHGEVQIGGSWFPREPTAGYCGSVAPPRDLPPRHALVLGARRPGLGNTDGIIRYSFPAADTFSDPIRGRYDSSRTEEALAHGTSSIALGDEFVIGPGKGKWEFGEVAKDPEDFAALLEIVRHHQLCISQRRQIHDWIQQQRQQPVPNEDVKRAFDRMEETLWKAWICNNDYQAMVNRCVTALEASPPVQFGTPERCIGVVWRYLCHGGVAEAVDKADAPSRAKLVKLAKEALKGSNHSSRNEAALFLARRTEEGEFPASRFHEFLESGVPEVREAGLEGLQRRGKSNEAGPWMLRQSPDDPTLCSYYQILRRGLYGEMPAWELEIIKRLLEYHASEALSMMSDSPRGDSLDLPSLCETSLRRALAKELEPTRRAWWNEQAERAADNRDYFPEQFFPKGLRYGMRQLDRFGAAEDAGLFTEFLDHPASLFGSSDSGNPMRFFTAREEAKAALVQRHIPLVEEVVTSIELPPPVVSKNPGKGFVTNRPATEVLYGLLGVTCLVVGIRFLRKPAT